MPISLCCTSQTLIMVHGVALPASQRLSHLVTLLLTAALLVGVVESFLSPTTVPHPPSRLASATSYNRVNAKLADHVAGARPASSGAPPRAWPPLPLQVSSGSGPLIPHASTAVVVSMVQGRARSASLPRVSAAARSAAAGSRPSCGSTRRLSEYALSLDDHGHDGDRGGDTGEGGRNGNGKGRGKGNGGNGNGNGEDGDGGESGGDDDGFGGERPLLLAGAGAGLAGALDGLREAIGNFRMPWSRKDEPSEEGQEGGNAEAVSPGGVEDELAKVLVADVIVDESVIPRDVLASAAVKSGLLGREASAARIQACASILNQWYRYEGYILSGVSNAVVSSNGTISFSVTEPVVSGAEPVQLLYYKPTKFNDPQSDLVRVEKGKTNPKTVARGLGLKGGEHFKVDAERWRGVMGSGLFNGAQLSGAHQNAIDQGYTLDINVEERRTVVFEPGVTKTLFDSNWAGEICFEEKNVLGRNGVLGLDMRRSMASPFTSFSLRLGNNRFGQPGAWQVSLFRDAIAPHSGSARGGGGGGGGYANSAIGPASSAPVFSTASPAGVPRDLGMLARSIRGAQDGRGVADAAGTSGNSTKEAVGAGGSDSGERGARAADLGLSRCHGVSLSSSWPFSFVKATAGAGYQQVSPPTNPLRAHGSDALLTSIAAEATGTGHIAGGGEGEGTLPPDGAPQGGGTREGLWVGESEGRRGSGALDVFTLSGGLSRDWRLPRGRALLRRWWLGGGSSSGGASGGASQQGSAVGGGSVAAAGGAGAGAGQAGGGGSASSFLDVKTGCLLEGGLAPRPFSQELITLVQRVPVGPQGKAGSWNATLNIRQQLQHCSRDTPLHQVPPFGGQRTIRGFAEGDLGRAKQYALSTAELRIPLRNLLGKVPAQGVVFLDLGAFRPVSWTRSASASAAAGAPGPLLRQQQRSGWQTAGGPHGGGIEGDSVEGRRKASPPDSDLHPPSPTPPPPPSFPVPAIPPVAASAEAYRVRRGQGLGLQIADLIQVDLGISRSGMSQLHIGLVDRNF